ncbi:phosphomevalonate kinase [Paucilactobacillus nenjiangensis]|uniref:phosphomevalonate kinase n=1 Tax=Paucilactobacillus nenjiangensis TaxID=1296540 RepID=UPI003BAFE1D9
MIKAAAPGKLYIAGEYAVVETGFPAILVALNQFVFCTVEKSSDVGSILSTQYSENSIYWRRQDGQMVFDNRDNPFHYILSAIKITEDYAHALGRDLSVYHLNVDSQLDSADGKKYGLGSSAAVTVATVKALCEFYQLDVTQDEIFKLSAIAHFEVQGNGSLGDIAASVYGGWIAYHSFDRQWLMEQRKTTSLIDLISMPWPELKIEQLKAPKNMTLLIGWTGSPASTSKLVDKVSIAKARESTEYQDFLAESRLCIQKMISGFRNGELSIIQEEIRHNRRILQNLSVFSSVSIETDVLTNLCDTAEEFEGAAKTSGAGGGDCGIVAIDSTKDLKSLINKWADAEIEHLDLSVHEIN